MAINAISNGESGLSVRGKLNDVIEVVNTNTGWGQYADTQYTDVSPFVVNAGVFTALPNNKGSVIESQLPDGTTTLYNGSRMTPDASGDGYILRVGFKAACSSNNGGFILSGDISATGDGSIPIFTESVRVLRGANTPQTYSVSANIYSLNTFLANGAAINFEAVTGNFEIYDIVYVISKIHAAR